MRLYLILIKFGFTNPVNSSLFDTSCISMKRIQNYTNYKIILGQQLSDRGFWHYHLMTEFVIAQLPIQQNCNFIYRRAFRQMGLENKIVGSFKCSLFQPLKPVVHEISSKRVFSKINNSQRQTNSIKYFIHTRY